MSSAKVKKEKDAPFGKCLACGEKFATWEWWGTDHKHVVASKTYFIPDEPVNCGLGPEGRVLKSRVVVTNVPAPHPDLVASLQAGGDDGCLDGGSVEFINGRLETSDPEVQHWLGLRGGWVSEKAWQQVWLTKAELDEIEMAESLAENKRLEREVNKLRELAGG